MLKKWVFAFILGLLLFLSWGHSASATVVAPAPTLVNPNISGGLFAPSMPAPLTPINPLPGSSAMPVPVFSHSPPDTINCDPSQYKSEPIAFTDWQLWAFWNGTGSYARPTFYEYIGPGHTWQVIWHDFGQQYILWIFYNGRYQRTLFGNTSWSGEDMGLYASPVAPTSPTIPNVPPLSPGNYPADYATGGGDPPAACPRNNEDEPDRTCTGIDVLPCLHSIFLHKFPFDFFYLLPNDKAQTCPIWTFFGKSFDMCWLYQAVSVFRYPAVIAVLIHLYIED
jgi:hypothetical protein